MSSARMERKNQGRIDFMALAPDLKNIGYISRRCKCRPWSIVKAVKAVTPANSKADIALNTYFSLLSSISFLGPASQWRLSTWLPTCLLFKPPPILAPPGVRQLAISHPSLPQVTSPHPKRLPAQDLLQLAHSTRLRYEVLTLIPLFNQVLVTMASAHVLALALVLMLHQG